MKFSYEEIYSMYGQFDALVRVDFVPDSEPFLNFGPSLMGQFIYSHKDRISCEESLKQDPIPRTNRYVRFVPSPINEIEKEKIADLEQYGFECKNIFFTSSYDRKRENRFLYKDTKEIPGTVNINVDTEAFNPDHFKLGTLLETFNSGGKLIAFEAFEFFGLMLYYHPKKIEGKIPEAFFYKETGYLIEPVRYFRLKAKQKMESLDEAEKLDYENILKRRRDSRVDILIKEFKKSDPNWKKNLKTNKESLLNLIGWAMFFEDQALLHCSITVWWDFERFVHICIRHVAEMQMGRLFIEKTVFQYNFKDFLRIVGIVIRDLRSDIDDHFKSHPGKVFRRMGERAHYYDGTFYRVEIEPSGRLLTFHPINNNQQENQKGTK